MADDTTWTNMLKCRIMTMQCARVQGAAAVPIAFVSTLRADVRDGMPCLDLGPGSPVQALGRFRSVFWPAPSMVGLAVGVTSWGRHESVNGTSSTRPHTALCSRQAVLAGHQAEGR